LPRSGPQDEEDIGISLPMSLLLAKAGYALTVRTAKSEHTQEHSKV
jgi:hypothetical protein